MIILSYFFFHCLIADYHCPYIGTCFRNHQYTDHWDHIRPQYNRNIESKAQYDCQLHPAERFIILFFCTFIKQNNDNQPHQCEWNITVNTPGKRSICGKPVILRHHAQNILYIARFILSITILLP